MLLRAALIGLLGATLGCPAKSQAPADAGLVASSAPADAATIDATAPEPPPISPDLHLDDYAREYEPKPTRRRAAKETEIALLLRSSPAGALAAVDGKNLGATPVLWRGSSSGRTTEVTFVLPGYAMARYRFIPTSSGIVHGTLKRLISVPKEESKKPPAPPAAPPKPKSPQ